MIYPGGLSMDGEGLQTDPMSPGAATLATQKIPDADFEKYIEILLHEGPDKRLAVRHEVEKKYGPEAVQGLYTIADLSTWLP